MNDDFLKRKLRRVFRRYQWLGFWRKLTVCWAVAALAGLGLVWVQRETGWASALSWPLLAALAVVAAMAVAARHWDAAPDYRWIARRIERAHPELKGLLLTAVQQAAEPRGEQGYLKFRVLQEATARSQEQDWRELVPRWRLAAMQVIHLWAAVCFVLVGLELRSSASGHRAGSSWFSADEIVVTPGDASVERGESLVVLARFGRSLPPEVNLVIREHGAAPRTISLVKSLADPVFGGSVPEVATDFTYRLEYGGRHTRDFQVTVFEHPRLVRSDADLAFPAYTKLAPKHIEDTRRVSAVEGTQLGLALQLNKPVASAKLVARDARKSEVPLTVVPGKAVANLPAFSLATSQTYDLRLVDADGRANKLAAPFVIDVQPNRPPELRLASPRGDVRPSALEEIAFEGTVWDDFGSPAYGLAYTMAGGETKVIELGHDVAAKEKRAFSHVLKLEELGAKPDDLISWYAWADDIGPDGRPRRTSSDLFFAEVRPFDEVFRESQGMPSPEEQPPGQGNQTRRLTDLEKQIINATWKLQRDGATPKYADDASVVRDSQQQALEQAHETMGEARAPREIALWQAATKEMEQALEKLRDAAKAPAPLAQALPAEQSAYQTLLKLQARETNVARGRNGGGAGGQQASQRQIDQLDLAQAENRYETQRQAPAPTTPERREQLQVMNRLQELARRQQDLNDRLKELQASLQEAKTEQEREDLRRRLKRLEEEQQQMLADVDEVRQRMDRPENQSQMSPERQQLDETRQDVQRAAEAAAQGAVAQALAAGTRAQRALQQMRDQMRKENSSRFADDLREMRSDARDLAHQQEQLGEKLDALGNNPHKTLGDSGDRTELLDEIARQKEKLNQLVDRATQVSEQAENTEPLLSRQLYDSVRKLSTDDANSVKDAKQELLNRGLMTRDLLDRLEKTAGADGGGKAFDLTREMLREGYLPQAGQAGQRTRGEVDELKRGVEHAAESVIGDDAEQLKLAQSELDQVTDQLRREIAQAQGREPGDGKPGDQAGRRETETAASQPESGPASGAPTAPREGGPAGAEGNGQPRDGQAGGGNRGGLNVDNILNGGGGVAGGAGAGGPITGDNFGPWTDRLRDVEELLDAPDLRDAVATAREQARLVRRDAGQARTKPDWTVVQLKVLKPLVEVRSRVAEELARRDSQDSLAPIDRDPVPNRFAESVRRYYEELGKDRTAAP